MRIPGLTLALCGSLFAQVSVLTEGYDANRTQANLHETILNPSNVDPAHFGRLFTRKVDSSVYARPLIVSGLEINGAKHNVLFIATMGNSVYAFDADDPQNSKTYWRRQLGEPSAGNGWIGPETVGILATPVIDAESSTLYVVTKNAKSPEDQFQVHALDLQTGKSKFNSPQRVTFPFLNGPTLNGSSPGLQRAGLLLSQGVLYAAFAAIVPNPDPESQEGFVAAFDAKDLTKRLSTFQVTPKGNKGGIWQAGRGLAADAAGNVYIATAGGSADAITDFGSSVVKLRARTLERQDFFTPANFDALHHGNIDLGANGVTLIPDSNLAFAGGKEGVVYLLDRDHLGGLESASSAPLQRFRASQGCGLQDCAQTLGTAFWSHPGAANGDGTLYVWDKKDVLRAYPFSQQRFDTNPSSASSPSLKTLLSSGPTLSANGSDLATGIVWAVTIDSEDQAAQQPGTLRAFLATDVSRELYNSQTEKSRDQSGNFTKFSPPVVANGKVYVVSQSGVISVYGLLPARKP
ncbi:MAG: hypothetical protein RL328_1145 [Acidobacteriota bacterium]|jgi:hypothetical protein